MSLRSTLFSCDDRLRACLVDDSQHVYKGCQGHFVSRIQSAVMILGDKTIRGDELARGYYGDSTAAAVLDFKRNRGIINYNYQTAADNVVGKMTIARLDQEMLLFELKCRRAGVPVRA